MREKGRQKLFDEYFSSIFSRSNVFSIKEYENSSSQFELNYERFLPSAQNAQILDVGCGAGHFLYYLKKKGYTDFLGIDISRQQVDFCRENISQRVERADAFEYLKDKKKAFDAVVANDLLEHILKEEIITFLKQVNAALKDNGVFLIRTPSIRGTKISHTKWDSRTGAFTRSSGQRVSGKSRSCLFKIIRFGLSNAS